MEQYLQLLEGMLTPKRFHHSVEVCKEAERLARKYGADVEKAKIAGILHDVMKDTAPEKQMEMMKRYGVKLTPLELQAQKLWHAMAGAAYVQHQLGIDDEEIVRAIRYHTTARAGMSLLEKVLYIADYTSAERDYPGVEDMRKAAEISLEKAMHDALIFSITDLVERERAVHPDTLDAYNEIMLSQSPEMRQS